MHLCEKTREFNKHFTDNLFTLRILVIKSMFVLINLENFEYCVNSISFHYVTDLFTSRLKFADV